jgi:hypothetical protein
MAASKDAPCAATAERPREVAGECGSPISDARDPAGIASAVAAGLGFRLGKGDPIEELTHALASRGRCLVILDNFV